jgi:hypothetical protein
MLSLSDLNGFGEEIERRVQLRTSPIAIMMLENDEMIFSIPKSRLEDLMFGLRHFDEVGRGYTRYAPDMRPEYPFSDLYLKAGRMVGIEVSKK